MERTQFDDIWDNILKNQKEYFTTSTGESFTYSIVDEVWIYPDHSREKYPIQKHELRKIFIQRAKGEYHSQNITNSYTCAWAILHDKRVKPNTKPSLKPSKKKPKYRAAPFRSQTDEEILNSYTLPSRYSETSGTNRKKLRGE